MLRGLCLDYQSKLVFADALTGVGLFELGKIKRFSVWYCMSISRGYISQILQIMQKLSKDLIINLSLHCLFQILKL